MVDDEQPGDPGEDAVEEKAPAEAEDASEVEAPEDGEQAEATAADTGDDSAEQERRGKPRRGLQERIDELTRQKYAAQAELEYWRQKAMVGQADAPPAQQAESVPDLPTLEQVGYDEAEYQRRVAEYFRAQAAAEARRGVDEALARREAAAVEAQRAAHVQQWLDDARQSYPDFEEVALAADLPVTVTMAETMQFMPDGATVAYALGRNPAEAARIARLPDILQVAELGRFAASLAQRQVSRKQSPPPPPRTLSGVSASVSEPDEGSMTDAEWFRYEMSKRQRR